MNDEYEEIFIPDDPDELQAINHYNQKNNRTVTIPAARAEQYAEQFDKLLTLQMKLEEWRIELEDIAMRGLSIETSSVLYKVKRILEVVG